MKKQRPPQTQNPFSRLQPPRPDATLQTLYQAVQFHQQGKLFEASRGYKAVLKAQPNNADALHMLGVVLHQQGRHADALAHINASLKLQPQSAQALSNLGIVLLKLGRPAEALSSLDRALGLTPKYPEALNNRGTALAALDRHADALASYDKALAISPNYAEALNNRGLALVSLKRQSDALASYERALTLNPRYAEALNNRGVALAKNNRIAEALASYDRAISLQPGYVEAFVNRGSACADLRRLDDALANFDRALELDANNALAHNNRGTALKELKRPADALKHFRRALAIDPAFADAAYNCGTALSDMKQFTDAAASFDRALEINPAHPMAFGAGAFAALQCCDWSRTAAAAPTLAQIDRAGIIAPFSLMGYDLPPSTLRAYATAYTRHKFDNYSAATLPLRGYTHDKIRVAYLSADFRRHAMGWQTVELFEAHDRARFEVFGVSFGPDDDSDIRKRIVGAFDTFLDVSGMDDSQVASLLRHHEIDIAVDLMGHTTDARLGILAHRSAPVQVSYLGFPGTTGADFIDYVLADATVVPFEEQTHFSEKIVQLPNCYQANDSKRAIATSGPTREQAGLPASGFVFCCFNNSYKITPAVFDVWMRLLGASEGSVLWLVHDSDDARRNLCAEAQKRGVDPARLVFAKRVALDQYLAQHRLADLFLDTLPYNAHGTGSMALWAGLPLVTCVGASFQGRVGASMLKAAGLPDLVTTSLSDYEALARRLASAPSELAAIRSRLNDNRSSCPLFNTDLLRRNIEAAFEQMRETHRRGEPQKPFAVSPE